MSKNKPPKDNRDATANEQQQPVRAGRAFVRASDKHEVMLKPNWPGGFRRTIKVGDESKVLEFAPGEPVEVTAEELKALKADIGVSIFEIERDEKGRPRYIESVATEVAPDPSSTKPEMDLEPGANAENV